MEMSWEVDRNTFFLKINPKEFYPITSKNGTIFNQND